MSGRRPADKAAQLDALYAQVPPIDCKGLCWDSCGPIRMTRTERRRIVNGHGIDIPNRSFIDGPATCEALKLRRCAVYEARPMVCRLWGVVEALPCTYGCVPGRYLTVAEGYELLAAACEVDGDRAGAARFRAGAARVGAGELRKFIADLAAYATRGAGAP